MNYIILDLEWDNSYFSPEKRFINQILQIGAVKLDENFKIVDTFEATIKSSFSKRVSGRFAKLTGITNTVMRAGTSLEKAVAVYNDWIGDYTVTMTWSNSDLYCIIENEKLLLNGLRFKIDKHLDLQSFVQNEMRKMGFEINSQISLSTAAELLKITTDEYSFHCAKDDCLVSAALLKKCYNEERFKALIKDTSKSEFFDRLTFKSYYITDINSNIIDESAMKFECDVCGGKAVSKSQWRFRNRWFAAEFECKKCGRRFCGRISFRKTYDDVIIKKKICELKAKEENKDEVQPVSATL